MDINIISNTSRVSGSFRDPSGFVFSKDNVVYRQVNYSYADNYKYLMQSGLYDRLVKGGLLIPHEEISLNYAKTDEAFCVIRPEKIEYIAYPYEWCFSQLKVGALCTLQIQRIAMEHNMSLKDCSAYNVQFHEGRPVFIDTLSFQKYVSGEPWIAYRQFCSHFLAPLAIMSKVDIRLGSLFKIFIDGIPLDLASKLLPYRSILNPSLFLNIIVHAKSQKKFADRTDFKMPSVSKTSILAMIDQLHKTIEKMKWNVEKTEWGDYYDFSNYSKEAFSHKNEIVTSFVSAVKPRKMWDFGGNIGVFSRIASDRGIFTISFDICSYQHMNNSPDGIPRCLLRTQNH